MRFLNLLAGRTVAQLLPALCRDLNGLINSLPGFCFLLLTAG